MATTEDTRWDLTELLAPWDGDLDAALDALDAAATAFATREEHLTPTITDAAFREIITAYASVIDTTSRVSAANELALSTATSDATLLARKGRIDERITAVENRIRFFTHWIKGLDDQSAHRLERAAGTDAYWVRRTRARRPYTLTRPVEDAIAIKDPNGPRALQQLYDLVDARTVFTVTIDGVERRLLDEQIRALFSDPRADVRRAAYDAFFATIATERDLLGYVYASIVRDWGAEGRLRGYATPIAVRNVANDIPDAVVAAHLAACRRNVGVWQRYFRVKEKLLGIPITRYDIYAPIPTDERPIPFADGVTMALNAIRAFSPRLGSLAQEIYDREHVDALPRAGKRAGAFCHGVTPHLVPYLFYNHTGRLRDVFTIAHETGHGVHAQIARDKSILSAGHALPVAETASVFAEMLLSEHLLASADAATRKALLVQKLNDLYATIARQSSFVLWEIEAHELIAQGKTIDDLSMAYLASLREQFGEMMIPETFKDEWLAIPHFYHSPFYCYAYSTGNLLTLALYETYRAQGASFVPKYESFLAAAETMDPVDLCRIVGADITDPSFWESGFAAITRMIDALEEMA